MIRGMAGRTGGYISSGARISSAWMFDSCRVDGTEGYKTSWNEPAYVADANCHAYLRQVVAIILFACANVASMPRYSAGPENMHAASIRKGFIS
jgi:hypothetical protein